MPNYHNISNYKGYSVKISPVSKWRRIFDWGYFSGGKVNFRIDFELVSDNPNDKFGLYKTMVYVCHPPIAGMDGVRDEAKGRDDIPVFVESSQVDGVGELAVYLGESDLGINRKYCLFTANIIHPDVIRRDVLMIVLGLIGSFIITSVFWLLGLIRIIPYWQLSVSP